MRMITFSRIWHRIGQIVELDIYRRQFGQIWQLRKVFVAIAGDSFFSFATRVIVSSIYIILWNELHDDFLPWFLSSIEIPWTIYLQFAITIIQYFLSCSDKLFSINGEIKCKHRKLKTENQKAYIMPIRSAEEETSYQRAYQTDQISCIAERNSKQKHFSDYINPYSFIRWIKFLRNADYHAACIASADDCVFLEGRAGSRSYFISCDLYV